MSFEKAVMKVVSEKGVAVVYGNAFFGLLDDYGAFDREPATRNIMKALVSKGCLPRLRYGWSLGTKDAVGRLTSEDGFDSEKVRGVLDTIGMACGKRSRCASGNRGKYGRTGPKQRRWWNRRGLMSVISATLVLCAAIVLFAVRCGHYNTRIAQDSVKEATGRNNPGKEATYINIVETLSCGFRSGSREMDVNMDGKEMTASSTADWCRAKMRKDGTLFVRWKRNATMKSRRCTVLVSSGTISAGISVSQDYDRSKSDVSLSEFSYDNAAVHDGVRCLDVSCIADVSGYEDEELVAVASYSIMDGLFSSRPMEAMDPSYCFMGKCASMVPVKRRGETRITVSIPFRSMERSSSLWLYCYADLAVYLRDGENFIRLESTGNRHYHYPDDYDCLVPSAEIEDLKCTYETDGLGKKKALVTSAEITVKGLKGRMGFCYLLCYDSQTRNIRSEHKSEMVNGTIGKCFSLDFTYDRTNWKELPLMIPLGSIRKALRKTGNPEGLVMMVITDGNNNVLARSELMKFRSE